ncbi:MAG: di-heme-cytochrome C peroxidase [Marinagarivorans sp.]|nr:di-heme-cytochrome C peroxidase [Marinagarivorans sp.]
MFNHTPFKKLAASLSLPLALTACLGEPTYLEQNWNDDNNFRAMSYHSSQGSQLIPYAWFLHLQVANSKQLVRDNTTIEQLRYLPDYNPDPDDNPDALPIGFVKDQDATTGDWLGFNCAACHTGQIVFGQSVIRIDGAPALGDYAGLLITLRDALQQTLDQPKRFNSFANNIGATDTDSLRNQITASIAELSGSLSNAVSPAHLPGYGRIDAFAAIRNEVFVTDLGIASNFQTPSAPVSYPFLWDTPQLERVQWTGHVENPYARNVGQVLGVQGRLNLQDPSQLFKSSIKRDNVFLLEEWIDELTAPQWPEAILGKINQKAAARGKSLYTTADASGYSCADCHSLKDDNGQYPLTLASQNAFGKQFIKTLNIPLAEIGTDPNTLTNVYDATPLQTGILVNVFGQAEMVGGPLLSNVTRATVGTLFAQAPALNQQQQVAFSGFRFYAPNYQPAPDVIGYKARPLAGIWATAPFLHNGSVPDLYNLLQTPERRIKEFWLGSMLFNNVAVGYVNAYEPGAFKFNTRISGNSNAGHRYGTTLSESQKWDLIEFLKTL